MSDKWSTAREILEDVQYKLVVIQAEAFLVGATKDLPGGYDAMLLLLAKAACFTAARKAERSPEEVEQDDVRLAVEILVEALDDVSKEVTNQLAARELYRGKVHGDG